MNVVQHYAIDKLGHTWLSRGSSADHDGDMKYLDASQKILDFFRNWTLQDTAKFTSDTTTRGGVSSRGGTAALVPPSFLY